MSSRDPGWMSPLVKSLLKKMNGSMATAVIYTHRRAEECDSSAENNNLDKHHC